MRFDQNFLKRRGDDAIMYNIFVIETMFERRLLRNTSSLKSMKLNMYVIMYGK